MASYITFLVILPLMIFFALRKGFSPWAWILATGVPGLVILLFMPSALDPNVDAATKEKRRKNGDTVGVVLSVVMFALGVVLTLLVSTAQR